jgi:hypothetical protein
MGDGAPGFVDRPAKTVTFRGKLDLPIHRWYRLTPSFAPRLALDIADHFGLGPEDLVLDPFSGVGTVPLCMKYRGIAACGIEWNPYLHFVGTVKTRTYRDLDRIESCVAAFLDRYRSALRALPPGESGAIGYLREHAGDVPKISKPAAVVVSGEPGATGLPEAVAAR